MPTAELLRLAEILDGAGYAYLEVSGGGAFDAAVRRGIESPWERIRAIKARTTTPLMLAVRGAFLVGSRPRRRRPRPPVHGERGRERHRRLPPPRPAQRRRQPARRRRGGDRAPDASSTPGCSTARSRHDALIETAKRLPEIGAARIVLDDPAGLLQPHRAGELVAELRELSGLPVGLYCQGAGRNGLAVALEAARAGVDLIGCAVYPVALATHRISAESLAQALAGHRPRHRRRRRHGLARRRPRRRAHRRHADQPAAAARLGAGGAPQASAGLVSVVDAQLRRERPRRPARRGARRGRARPGRRPARRRSRRRSGRSSPRRRS